MLNISKNTVSEYLDPSQFKSFSAIKAAPARTKSTWIIGFVLIFVLIGLNLPWTQNIRAKGQVTTLQPNQRPQSIQSIISGRIEKWYVTEGQFVKANDTIAFVSEVKTEYFDPELVLRTNEQLDAKSKSVDVYDRKISNLASRNSALLKELNLKISQLKNKITQQKNYIIIDSIQLAANYISSDIAQNQLERKQTLYDKGLKSLNELQAAILKRQNVEADIVAQESKLMAQKQELRNLNLELLRVGQDFADKNAKALSDQQSARSAQLETQVSVAKLRNQISNYEKRQTLGYILAPQDGFVTQTLKRGVGEIVSAGEGIATIMPSNYDLAVSIKVKGFDVPLLQVGSNVRLRFDGWPAIVISGWPEASTGIFSGQIFAIDQFMSENGYYRVLIQPNEKDKIWPERLRVGAGAETYILLKDVPVWYELWRRLNGFPPDYYQQEGKSEDQKLKAPIKSVK